MERKVLFLIVTSLLIMRTDAHAGTPLTTPAVTATPTVGSNAVGNEIWCYAVNVASTTLQ